MRVHQYNNLQGLQGSTVTLQDFSTVLGTKPYLAKEVVKSTTNKNLTLLRIAEDFGGKIYKEKGKVTIDSMVYDWNVETGSRIPKIKIAEDCNDTDAGKGASEFAIILERDFYTLGCTIELDNGQQLIVVRKPETLAEGKVRCYVKPITGDRTVFISPSVLTKGSTTRYISKATVSPEMHDFGASYKDEFNIEKHRQWLTRFRMGYSISGDAKLLLPNIIEEAPGIYYKQSNIETKLMGDLLESVNRAGLFAEGNMEATTFNCLTTTEDGRPIPIGQGILPQMKAFGNFMPYKAGGFSIQKMKDIINEVVSRREQKVDNEIIVLCNYRLFVEIQSALATLAAGYHFGPDDYNFSKAMKDRWVIGADYAGYRFAGNKLLFMVETAFSNQYPDKGFGIVFNLYAETSSGSKPNVQELSMKGMDLVTNYIDGAGGRSGSTSGVVSSKIHASEVIMFKYSAFVVNDPYGTMFIEETTY